MMLLTPKNIRRCNVQIRQIFDGEVRTDRNLQKERRQIRVAKRLRHLLFTYASEASLPVGIESQAAKNQ